jgi:NNP family nitrate/nitrite transporter-like MFS transporter
MSVAHSIGLSTAAELLMGAGMGASNAAVFKLVPAYVPDAVGGASGWVGGVGAFGGFIIPPVLGLFVELLGTASYACGFLLFAAFAGLGILIARRLGAIAASRGRGEAPQIEKVGKLLAAP